MSYQLNKLAFFTFLFFQIHFSYSQNKEIDSLFRELDKAIELRPSLKNKREEKIKDLKTQLEQNDTVSLEDKYFLAEDLFHQYEVYEFGGALYFAYEQLHFAEESKNELWINQGQLNLASILVTSGIYEESGQILQKIDRSKLSQEQLIQFYYINKERYNQLYFYSTTRKLKEGYRLMYQSYCDTLLYTVPQNSIIALDIKETRALDNRNLLEARKFNTLIMNKTELGQRDFSKAAFIRSLTYEVEHDIHKEKKYLILSAISDIMSCTNDNASLATLALLLHKQGDIDRAYRYINISFEDASFYGSKLRSIQIANIQPIISKSYEDQLSQKANRFVIYTILISVLSIIALVTLIIYFRQLRALKASEKNQLAINQQLSKANEELLIINQKLKEVSVDLKNTSHVKEVYIGEFLKICSDYIDKLEKQSNHTKKMLVERKYSKLLDELKNNDLRKNEMKAFYKNFDETFLTIYPNFVDKLNQLLDPNDPIRIKNNQLLNTELRIFALIRLGITDSNKIAQLLGNSVITIYNYRVKVKNKSIVPREELEDFVMKID
ncbi:hypothetical protein KMW28_02630 [Flammeovirga yaeyamensis]|uniref:DUF6377 domain-containing protein n=1 Tax=Flammeovirga yaeyamensis TaxID=367791 RepID=A0AAX1N4I1_9BACT|nr:DUF6377 domain-containing protein [Flammeovirga yaeyamensis]MBB3700406.1 hypothetical protein [Flammeovirga yaeyamensis]NMF36968.1 hypothetical protein [Flammeovirga yaeyamensis]QWG02488.1 hypothetical protein KMW28_02630 [Flammeovirga yaeyamensis]